MESYSDHRPRYNPDIAPYPPGRYKYGNPNLPIAYYREDIDRFLENMLEPNTPVGLLAGRTGSGKTTTMPQAAYETGLFDKIYISEPKIMLTREARERNVQEMAAIIGYEAADRLVGYATGSESHLHEDNKIIYATHQYMTKLMIHQGDQMAGRVLYGADEYHDREREGDISVEVAKKFGIPTLLMSATMDLERTAAHHRSYDGFTPAPILQVEGRQHEIEHRTMSSSTEAVVWALENGLDVQYCLPGKAEIDAEIGRINRMTRVPHVDLPLHGEQSKSEQRRAFQKYDKPRVIYATKIGDSGVTLGVDVVVDTQLERTVVLRGGVPTLTTRRTSKATSQQRGGRSGRDRKGIHIEAPYPDAPAFLYETEQPDFSPPEIVDSRVDSAVLSLAVAGMTMKDLDLMDQPGDRELERSEERLRRLGAFATQRTHTELSERGAEMAHLPLDPGLAKMVVASREYSEDVHRFMAIGAVVAQIGGVGTRMKDKENWRRLSKDKRADLLRDLDVFLRARRMSEAERQQYNILDQKMDKVEKQLKTVFERETLEDTVDNRLPTEQERELLAECIVSGSEELYFHRSRKLYKDPKRKQNRRMAADSSVKAARIIAGQPWNQEEMRPKTMNMRQGRRIKNAVNVDGALLVRAAPERCSYKDVNYELGDDGEIIVQRELLFDGRPTREMVKSVLQESTPELRSFIINGLFQESLPNESVLPESLRDFRREITELRQYEHRSPEHLGVEELMRDIQAEIDLIIPKDAQTIDEIMQHADANFIRGFMTNEQRRQIELMSPTHIKVEGSDGQMIDVAVRYKDHNAEITVKDYDDVRSLPTYIPELDGRFVTVRIESSGKVESLQIATSGKYAGSREQRRGNKVMQLAGYLPNPSTGPVSTAFSPQAQRFAARQR